MNRCKHGQIGGCLECAGESNKLAISELNDCLVSMQKREAKKSKRIAELEKELEYLKAEKKHFMSNLERQAVFVSKEALYKFWNIAEKAAKRFVNYSEPQGGENDCFNCECEECHPKTKAKEVE